MALVQELCEIYAGDVTPLLSLSFTNVLRTIKEKVFSAIEIFKKEKEKILKEYYKTRKRALQRLILNLPVTLKKSLIYETTLKSKLLKKANLLVRFIDFKSISRFLDI